MDNVISRRRAPGMSALAQRLPGQRTPPDPSLEQPNAADLTYGWHLESSSEEEQDPDMPAIRRRGFMLDDDEANEEEDDDDDVFTDVEEDDEDDEEERQRHLRQQNADEVQQEEGLNNQINLQTPLARGSMFLLSLWNKWWFANTGTEEDISLDEDNSADPSANSNSQQDEFRDSFVCRICFDGPGSIGESGESLGKLIAPCKCRGTMKFVHQGCLTRWRATSRRQTSIMQCDQCGAPYRFKKSRFVGLATNKALLIALSCYMFISLVWIVGYAAEATMAYMDESAVQSRKAVNEHKKQTSSYWPSWLRWGTDTENAQTSSTLGNKLYSAINLDRAEEPGYYDYDDFYGYRYDYRYAYSEPVAYYTLIKAAVKYVGSGRALSHLFPSTTDGFDASPPFPIAEDVIKIEQQIRDDEKGWWATLLDDWKYGKGGIWEGQRPSKESKGKEKDGADAQELLPSQSKEDGKSADPQDESKQEGDHPKPMNKETEQIRSETIPIKPQRERYDAVTAKSLKSEEKVVRPITRKRVRKGDEKRFNTKRNQDGKPTFVERIVLQLSLGASLVGMSSFLTLLLGVSTWVPFHLNLGLGRGFARVARRRARGSGGSGGGGGEGEALVAVFLLFLVVVGIIRALFAVYKLTNYFSKRLLTRVEDIILDWGSEEDDQVNHRMNERGEEHQENEPHAAFHAEQHIVADQENRRHWRERFNPPAWTMRFRRRRNQNIAD